MSETETFINRKPRRFYKAVGVAFSPASDGDDEEGYRVLLDQRPLRTPAKAYLTVPTEALAQAVAAEWEAQGDEIDAATMPLTQLVNTAQDRLAQEPEPVISDLMRFAETDLLCYRADEPADLIARQEDIWQPVVDWASSRLDVGFAVTSGILPVTQPPQALEALERYLKALDPYRLTAMYSATGAARSVLLGLALVEGRLEAPEVYEASQLDEEFQAEFWGKDPQAEESQQVLKKDILTAGALLALVKADN